MAWRGYRLHGFDLFSEIALPNALEHPVHVDHAVLVSDLGTGAVPSTPPPDAELVTVLDGAPVLWLAPTEDGWEYVLPGYTRIHIQSDLRQLTTTRDPAAPAEILPIVLAGGALAALATLQGRMALHAAAVTRGDAVVAFAGPSGVGKSTTLALAVGAGAHCFADDVLCLEGAPHPVARRGSSEIRLRPHAADLSGRIDAPVAETVDGRVAVGTAHGVSDAAPLAVILLPRPDRDRADVHVALLDPPRAFPEQLACMRLTGWTSRPRIAANFDAAATLASGVAVAEVRIPWGPPFGDGLGDELLNAIDDLLAQLRPVPLTVP